MKDLIKNNSDLIAHYKKYKEFLEKENSFFSLQQIEHCNWQIALLIKEIEQYKRENPYRGYNGEKREVKHEPFTKTLCYGKFLDMVTDREEIERLSEIECERQMER